MEDCLLVCQGFNLTVGVLRWVTATLWFPHTHNTTINSYKQFAIQCSLRTVPPFVMAQLCSAHLGTFGFLKNLPTNTTIFLCSLRLCGKSRSWQGLSETKKKIVGNHAFFKDI